jgi:hypothetical protein
MTTKSYEASKRQERKMPASTTRKPSPEPVDYKGDWQPALLRFLPAWIILAMVLTILLPNLLLAGFGATGRAVNSFVAWAGTTVNGGEVVVASSETLTTYSAPPIAPLFTSEVDYWGDSIRRWASEYNLDPNLMATVMQIESCGWADAASHAGAQGLFQVMPFHFAPGEVYIDPDTNAMRSANFLNECLAWSNGDTGLAMACYNGGPSITQRAYNTWPDETQRYYMWGTGIYQDAVKNLDQSTTLTTWLNAGGSSLCTSAAASQGVPFTPSE